MSKRSRHAKKLFKQLSKEYYSFDMVETIPNTLSAYVIDFWENGGMEMVSYEVDDYCGDHWKKWYDRFYACYIWFKYFLPMYSVFAEKMLNEAYERKSKLPFEKHFEFVNGQGVYQLIHILTEEEEEKSGWYTKVENFINETNTYYIKEIADLYNGMWT